MNTYETVIHIQTEREAQLVDQALQDKDIPHVLKSYHDSVFDGLYQSPSAWGHIEAPLEFKNDIVAIVEAVRDQPVAAMDDAPQGVEGQTSRRLKRKGGLALLLLACLVLGSWGLFKWHIRTHYREATGRVVAVSIQPIGWNANLAHPARVFGSHLVIAYRVMAQDDDLVDGKEVYGEINVTGTHFREGDAVTVLYSTAKPGQCMLK